MHNLSFQGGKIVSIFFRVWVLLSNTRKTQVILLLFLMVVSSFAEVISIGAILPFLGVLISPDQVFDDHRVQPLIELLNISNSQELLNPIAIVFCIAIIVSTFLRLVLMWGRTRFGAAISAEFSIDMYTRTLYQPYAKHISENSSEIIASSEKAGSLGDAIISPILSFISSFVLLTVVLIALVSINTTVAISAIFGFGSIYISISYLTKKNLNINSYRKNYEQGRVLKAIQEGLGGIRDVIINRVQQGYIDIYSNSIIPLKRAQANISIISSSPRYLVEALGMLLIVLISIFLVNSSSNIDESIPVLGVIAMGAQRIMPAMQEMYSSISTLRGDKDTAINALEALEQPILKNIIDKDSLLVFDTDIHINNLWFKYEEKLPWTLERVDLTISKGDRVGFIGTTGSGKSTLLDIIMGLLEPTRGSIHVDGELINNKNLPAWQKHISHVPQFIHLSDSTVAENIAFGVHKEKINMSLVMEVAEKSQLSETIESWSLKYDTIVGERGIRLSGGQRQRIGIARALYKKADVIIFDEATSALDGETERAIIKSIDSLSSDLTILVIAHRITTLQNCSKIVEISDGRVGRIVGYEEIVH